MIFVLEGVFDQTILRAYGISFLKEWMSAAEPWAFGVPFGPASISRCSWFFDCGFKKSPLFFANGRQPPCQTYDFRLIFFYFHILRGWHDHRLGLVEIFLVMLTASQQVS